MANDFSEYVAKIVETKFLAAWTTLHSTMRVIMENDKSTPLTSDETGLDFSIIDNEDRRKDLGASARSHEYSGIVNININVPKGTSTRALRRYADEIMNIFRDVYENEVRYTGITFKKIGHFGDHFVGNVSIEVKYRKIYTS